MVNWKNPESTDRLIASLIAANSGLKLDYHAIALLFGQGATYDSIEGRFRRYRKMADQLRDEVHNCGITDIPHNTRRNYASGGGTPSTPRTPRVPRGGITKSTPSSSRSRNYRYTHTPTKQKTKLGMSALDAIYVEDADPEEEEESKIKPEPADVASSNGDDDVEITDSHSVKIKKERAEHNMAGIFAAVAPKKEEEGEKEETHAFGTGAGSTRAQSHDGKPLYSSGMNHSSFYMAGTHFEEAYGSIMKDVHRGAA
ncbi:hypothetical protein BDV26DRAFT_289774 [Aspergillus bertholletiae]|uniref:Uncharacterized protein n=1 Tax=Aspergillus bertholletiae TaxID=1226010 RepID=A0A5N7BH20_9EURO|nr:hypothetical protein BDV26DRAFT_289774 [Aspergillus bertholletiae]